jgi:hypothetical protein
VWGAGTGGGGLAEASVKTSFAARAWGLVNKGMCRSPLSLGATLESVTSHPSWNLTPPPHSSTSLLHLTPPPTHPPTHPPACWGLFALPRRYRKLLLGVDLTKHFFFSYSYSLAHTLQYNHLAAGRKSSTPAAAGTASEQDASRNGAAAAAAPPSSSKLHTAPSTLPGAPPSSSAAAGAANAAREVPGWDAYDGSMFVWNAHLTRPLRQATGCARWTLPLVHGFWEQRQVRGWGGWVGGVGWVEWAGWVE